MWNIVPTLHRIFQKVVENIRSCKNFLTTRYFFKKLQKILREVFPDDPAAWSRKDRRDRREDPIRAHQ
jgi:hypothetical protein